MSSPTMQVNSLQTGIELYMCLSLRERLEIAAERAYTYRHHLSRTK